MTTLVIGSEGVIGRALVRRLRQANHLVLTADRTPSLMDSSADSDLHTLCDITHPETLRRAFTSAQYGRPDVVFHLAGAVGRVSSEWASVALRANVEGTQNVVDLCWEYGAHMVYASSSEVYGAAFNSGLVDEETPFANAAGIYGLSKQMGERLITLAYHRGLSATVVRPFMCYAVDEPLTPHRSAIARMMRAILQGKPPTVHEGAVRSWCYAADIAEGFARLGEGRCDGTFNVGRDDPVSMWDVGQLLLRLAGKMYEPVVRPLPGGVFAEKHASFDRLEEATGFRAGIELADGLRRVVVHHIPERSYEKTPYA